MSTAPSAVSIENLDQPRETPEELDVSVLVPVKDEAETVEELSRQVAKVLDGLGKSFEIVFVDDGSQDGTQQRIKAARERDERVKLVWLRRNFGKAAALSAGFDVCRGQVVITMDGDLQDDPAE
ncbi:MAG: glycosyltransferase, partial [Acidobacteria bacterium]|nr:glycosyltransferase [Acidobacteriota bacterium]